MGQDKPKAEKQSVVLVLLADIADTTWRMFLPAIVGTLSGLWLDQRFETEPWFAITGLVIGIAVTAALVRQHYKKIQ